MRLVYGVRIHYSVRYCSWNIKFKHTKYSQISFLCSCPRLYVYLIYSFPKLYSIALMNYSRVGKSLATLCASMVRYYMSVNSSDTTWLQTTIKAATQWNKVLITTLIYLKQTSLMIYTYFSVTQSEMWHLFSKLSSTQAEAMNPTLFLIQNVQQS